MRKQLLPSQSLLDIEPLDLRLSSGPVRAYRLGPAGAPTVVCLHGLDSNARSLDVLAGMLVRRGHQVLVPDLRGRGASPATGVGTYGWVRHARDVLELATALGVERFDLLGHSMGALIAMQAVVLAPERVGRLIAIDTAGPTDLLALPFVASATLRLPFVYPSAGGYCAAMRSSGVLEPWEDLWKRTFAYELEGFWGFVRPRTSFRAVGEDFLYNLTHTGASLWPRLRLPTILLRATRRLPPFGLVVGTRLRDAFLRTVKSAELAEIDANHYEILAHPEALRAIDEFLARPTPTRARQTARLLQQETSERKTA